MGFIVNSQEIDMTKLGALPNWIKAERKKIIDEYGLNKKDAKLKFIYPKNLVKKSVDNPGKMDKPRSATLNYRETIKHATRGVEDWRYFETVTTNEKGVKIYSPLSLNFSGGITFESKDIDLIFWFLVICSRTVDGQHQNKDKIPYIMVKNEDKMASNEVAKIQLESEIKFKILNPESKGGMDEKELRQIAGIFFISQADIKSIDLIRVDLIRRLEKQNNGWVDFQTTYEDMTAPKIVIKALVQRAIDLNVIVLEKKNKQLSEWHYVAEDGKIGSLIKAVHNQENANDKLAKFFFNNPKHKDSVELEVNRLQEEKEV